MNRPGGQHLSHGFVNHFAAGVCPDRHGPQKPHHEHLLQERVCKTALLLRLTLASRLRPVRLRAAATQGRNAVPEQTHTAKAPNRLLSTRRVFGAAALDRRRQHRSDVLPAPALRATDAGPRGHLSSESEVPRLHNRNPVLWPADEVSDGKRSLKHRSPDVGTRFGSRTSRVTGGL